jgi:nickel/cobalt transporter (NicO) family protein
VREFNRRSALLRSQIQVTMMRLFDRSMWAALRLAAIAAMQPVTVALAQSAGTDASSGGSSFTQLSSRLFFWIQDQQQWFSQNMNGALEKLAGGNAWNAALLLATFSFIYGVLHAVGPGHGKTVVSSYVLANAKTLRRGVLIAFMAGFFQAMSAIVIVSVMALLLNLGSHRMDLFSNNLETISWAVITLFGVWLLFTQARRFLVSRFASAHAAHDHDHAGHDHDGHDHDQEHAHGDDDGHDHHGHAHLPGASELQGAWSWSEATGMALMAGLRPCTGALIVLVGALHQHLYWAGIVATFVMALGTSITVSLLAIMAVSSRDLATRLAGESELWVGRVEGLAKVGGGLIMAVLGFAFFLASLHPHPFQ